MTAVVFLGPSLPPAEARQRLGATFLPPAAQGDIWRAAVTLRPTVIGLVDGVFRHTPSVWHKEILFALSQGIHVLGAASMGALRAAELAAFGMRGVGTVFEAYRDGRLAPSGDAPFEDDDEVAVLHAPAEAGWQPLSEAMVDVRCSLAAAATAGVLDEAERRAVTNAAKRIFFAERTWSTILEQTTGLAPPRRAALAAWLEHGRVRQKRADACLLLDEIRSLAGSAPPPFQPAFRLAHTTMWAMAIAEAGRAGPNEADTPEESSLAVLDELRLDPPAWRSTLRAALLDELAADRGTEPSPQELRAALADLRLELGLADRRSIEAWTALNEVQPNHLQRLAAVEARLRGLERRRRPHLLGRMLDRLRAEGRYAGLRARAAAKAAHTRRSPPENSSTAPDDLAALRWYFERRRAMDIPEDLEAYARDLGFADAAGLCRALQLEYRFVLSGEEVDGSANAPS